MPNRAGVNPFTKEKVESSGAGKGIYKENGAPQGNFGLEGGRILFTGVPESVGLEVASLIGATLKPWDNS